MLRVIATPGREARLPGPESPTDDREGDGDGDGDGEEDEDGGMDLDAEIEGMGDDLAKLPRRWRVDDVDAGVLDE
ncbi:hypothetical protein EDB92DRAFT_1938808 [Lactarius akahatsu]|uniref:Uncharacterized protein n=1 Tax=Lactarius akahatsu TaxID=416441 RepID=A0AAD4LQ22_9AGAM|nr:hypothetical protein EDB92DRAFT_1938808 [Lactarius akahatsu]